MISILKSILYGLIVTITLAQLSVMALALNLPGFPEEDPEQATQPYESALGCRGIATRTIEKDCFVGRHATVTVCRQFLVTFDAFVNEHIANILNEQATLARELKIPGTFNYQLFMSRTDARNLNAVENTYRLQKWHSNTSDRATFNNKLRLSKRFRSLDFDVPIQTDHVCDETIKAEIPSQIEQRFWWNTYNAVFDALVAELIDKCGAGAVAFAD